MEEDAHNNEDWSGEIEILMMTVEALNRLGLPRPPRLVELDSEGNASDPPPALIVAAKCLRTGLMNGSIAARQEEIRALNDFTITLVSHDLGLVSDSRYNRANAISFLEDLAVVLFLEGVYIAAKMAMEEDNHNLYEHNSSSGLSWCDEP